MLCTLAFLAAPALGAPTYSLSPTWPDGRTIKSTAVVSSTNLQMGQTVRSKQTTVTRQQATALPTGTQLDVSVLEYSIDHDAPPAEGDPTAAIAAAMVGASYQVTMDPAGKVTGVTGMDRMMESVVDSMSKDLPDAAREGMRAALSSLIGEDAMARLTERSTAALPSEPKAVGDSWSRDVDMALAMGIGIDLDYSCNLESVQASLATVRCDVDGELSLDSEEMLAMVSKMVPGADQMPPEMMEVVAEQIQSSISLDEVEGTETHLVDLERGLVSSSQSKVRTVMTVQGQRAEQIAESNTRNELL